MKKIITILLFSFFITSCSLWGESEELKEAKNELLNTGEKDIKICEDTWEICSLEDPENDIDDTSSEIIKIEKSYTKISYPTDEKFIEINELPKINSKTDKIEINWETLEKIDKIIVYFHNEWSSFPNDEYELQWFKPWDSTFKYRAYKEYEVLDVWLNEYIIEAYSGSNVSKTKIEIFIPEEEDEKIDEDSNYEYQNLWDEDNIIYLKFPKSEEFWEVLMLGKNWFTYSNINWLEVNINKDVFDLACDETITNYLVEEYGWNYWNTCRPIITDKWISFYVLRLEWEEWYIYEKHYLDQNHGLYWVYEIEKGIGINKDNISEKNDEFKERDYEWVSVVDNLFKKIVE